MNKTTAFFLIYLSFNFLVSQTSQEFVTNFEKSGGTETETYQEVISYFENLSHVYPQISIQEMGKTDSGKPLHIVTYNPDKQFDFSEIRKNKRILLINNGIHPGETDGIDATMLLYRDLVQGKVKAPKNTVLVTIPIYNVGGSLNRNTGSRANQNGPKEYGFRGNARNYDLNRDFIKCDTKNAKSFTEIFHLVQPDVFIDNHVSNGADYQYTLTHLFTQHNKLNGNLGLFLNQEMMPALENKLAQKDWDITPYVNVFNQVPEIGFSQFMDYPRYSTGYTALWSVLGMMVETHMLKPYKQRVEGTYELMISMIEVIEDNYNRIALLREDSASNFKVGTKYPLDWVIDESKSTTLNFKGFEGEMITSDVTGSQRLKYNRNKPFTKEVEYENYFKPSVEVTVPKAYIIPQGWHDVIDLLKLNKVEMTRFEKDTSVTVSAYKIATFETRKNPYEGHYQHYSTSITSSTEAVRFRKGDYFVTTNQPAKRYLLETLEPQAPDSFFNWNFFDMILQQKEGFSPYVFEDTAKNMLDSNAELKAEFLKKKESDKDFNTNWYAQLNWLYQRSNHAEKAYMQYPIYRLN
ncbi:M14 family metallopeptidase [Xanthomarina sp. F1114]|uniref:M14 family metallopeptidase n=1 Tax=Xanthomarina sp. F1114 TaxID=2996019 RepID=UPI00225E26EE|nr:M14 family metallopeptidase [Xanthomarina sp. F1114]MCX7547628.1 M14 family metallopeptidase [Xanthomarina sp. F1114]